MKVPKIRALCRKAWNDPVLASIIGGVLLLAIVPVGRWLGSLAAITVPTLNWLIALVVLVVAIWFVCIYLYFQKTPTMTVTAEGQTNWERRPLRVRHRLAVGIVLMPLIVAVIVGLKGWQNHRNRPGGRILVLVADFEENGSGYEMTRTIVEDLRKATRKYPDVRIERLRRIIPWENGDVLALEEGKRRGPA